MSFSLVATEVVSTIEDMKFDEVSTMIAYSSVFIPAYSAKPS